MAKPRSGNFPITRYSDQQLQNLSFDDLYNLLAVMLTAEGPDQASIYRLQVDETGALKVSGGTGGSSGGLTNAQLRATPVPVDIGNASVNINGPVTVSNEVEVKNDVNSPLPVSGTLNVGNFPTSTEIANDVGNPIPISASSLPLATGAATSAKQLPDNHQVTISNFPANTEISNDVGNPIPTVDANKQSLKFYSQILTANGSITPASGKRLKILKVQVLQSPDNTSANPVTLSLTSIGSFITGWAYSDSSEITGAVDEALAITLGSGQAVSVNIRYKEI